MNRWAIINASRILTMDNNGQPYRGNIKTRIIEKGCIIWRDERIELITDERSPKELRDIPPDNIIDAGGRLVTPGLVDSHTHTVFYGTREREYGLRIAGASYAEIAAAGGGILNTVKRVREATEDQLFQHSLQYLDSFLTRGTTTVEMKSGYGLSTESELKMLHVMKKLGELNRVEVVTTFLGAHEIPAEYRSGGTDGSREDFINLIKNEMIPAVAENKLAKYCDVFCEEGVFTVDETRDLLLTGRKFGLEPRFHADEIVSTDGAVLAAEIGAKSAGHLGAVSDRGIEALAASNTVATLLPGTVVFLNLDRFAPARRLIDSGAIVALASDFNPGSCPTNNMQLIMTLAASRMRMTIEECWAAVTLNPAFSLDLADRKGSLTPGYDADLVIWDTDNEYKIPYHFGIDLRKTVIKGGKIAYSNL